jgi:hypothetical protein
MKRLIILISFIGLLISCKHDAIVPDSRPVSFTNEVQPIIISNCTKSGCHGNTNQEVFPLMTYDDIMNNGGIIPGNPGQSNLYQTIIGKGGQSMPPDYFLSSDQMRLIYFWIAQGAKNN